MRQLVVCVFAGVLFVCSARSAEQAKAVDVQVNGTDEWVDSTIDVAVGDSLVMRATGTVHFMQAQENGPDGLPRGWKDLIRVLPFNEAGRGALIGRIGSTESALPFLIGASKNWRAPSAGRLFLRINRADGERPEGSYAVKVEITRAEPTRSSGAAAAKPPLVFTQQMLDGLPARVSDDLGNDGDRVNFIVVGTERSLREALQAAGWVQANRSTKDAVIQATLASFSKQAYTQLPMSELKLFGRPQDYGFAHADPLQVIASRHHFRIWKAPFEAESQTVWVGAGTHDIGFDRDRRNNKITHKIDPEVDKERDYIGETLANTGLVARVDYLTPAKPVREASTATGATFRSDGRTLVMTLVSSGVDDSARFADLFCTVLAQENPDGGEWGDCGRYFTGGGTHTAKLNEVSTRYRLLIIPGILNTCASDSPAFQEGQVHLKEKHGTVVELLAVPNDSSETNAQLIVSYLREHMKTDTRKYIVIGYSKGAPDLQVALASDATLTSSVAAFVTIAGAVGGSPIADLLPKQAEKWMKQYGTSICKGDLSEGFKSLRKDARKAFLSANPVPVVPTYSIAAVSDRTNTSKMLLETWQLLSAYGSGQDGQVIKDDALVPGAKYLGEAKGDHFAVGLPLEKRSYPRATLLETVFRYVTEDLGTGPL